MVGPWFVVLVTVYYVSGRCGKAGEMVVRKHASPEFMLEYHFFWNGSKTITGGISDFVSWQF